MNDPRPKPLYLAALTANNSPGDTWGPRRRVHQYGVYAHLLAKSTKNKMSSQQPYLAQSVAAINTRDTSTGIINPSFEQNSTPNYDDVINRCERF
jgi:hypothetical protein